MIKEWGPDFLLVAAFVAACFIFSGCTQLGPALSDVAATACKGQAAANLATDAAVALGNRKAAELASATSAYLGMACKW